MGRGGPRCHPRCPVPSLCEVKAMRGQNLRKIFPKMIDEKFTSLTLRGFLKFFQRFLRQNTSFRR